MGVALAAVEPVEDVALHLRAHARPRVLHLHRDRAPVAVGTEGDGAPPGVLRGVLAEVAECLLEQVAVRVDGEPGRHLDLDGDAGVRNEPGRHLPQERRELDRLDPRQLLSRVRAGERQHRPGEPREPAGLPLDVGEEAVPLGGILLRSRLQHLDGADDCRQRRAQLVRGVRDELALGELPPLLLGQVVDDEQGPVRLGLGGDADDAVCVLLVGCHVHLRDGRPFVEQPRGELAELEALPRLGQRVSLSHAAAEQPARLGVREVDDEILVDREQPLEQEPQTVALRLEAPEGPSQLAAHAFEAVGEGAELVAEAVAQRRLEVSVRDRLGGRAQAAQPQGDELREQEAHDDADHSGDDARPERLAVDRVDRRGHVRAPADCDECLTAIRNGRHERPSVGSSTGKLVAGERSSRGVAHEARRRRLGFGCPDDPEPDVALVRNPGELRRRNGLGYLGVLEGDTLAVPAERVLGVVRKLRDDDRGRRRSHDRERHPEPPADSDKQPWHGSIVGFRACRKGIRSTVRRSGCRFSSAGTSRSRLRIRARP